MPVAGTIHKNLRTVVTWDYVNEPGLSAAMKWNSPSLESVSDDIYITAQQLGSVRDWQASACVSMESSGGVNADEVLKDFGWSMESQKENVPPSSKW